MANGYGKPRRSVCWGYKRHRTLWTWLRHELGNNDSCRRYHSAYQSLQLSSLISVRWRYSHASPDGFYLPKGMDRNDPLGRHLFLFPKNPRGFTHYAYAL